MRTRERVSMLRDDLPSTDQLFGLQIECSRSGNAGNLWVEVPRCSAAWTTALQFVVCRWVPVRVVINWKQTSTQESSSHHFDDVEVSLCIYLTHSDALLYLRDIKGKSENEVVGRSCCYEKISEFKFFAYSALLQDIQQNITMQSLHKQTRNLERNDAELLLSAGTGKGSRRFGYVYLLS